MSTKSIIKLAEKFEKKYSLVKEADTFSESERMKQTIVAKFPEIMKGLKDQQTGVTLTVDADGRSFVIKEKRWAQSTPDDVKKYYDYQFDRVVIPYLNQWMAGQFEDGPWSFTIPPLK